MEKIFDIIRQAYVVKTPEEQVRQNILSQMVDQLGYPRSHLAVEKKLSLLPHLDKKQEHDSRRRIDILCFAKDIHPTYELYPLLLIECKATPLNQAVFKQLDGYNYYIKAFFWGVINYEKFYLFWKKGEKQEQLNFLPSYKTLLQAVHDHRKY